MSALNKKPWPMKWIVVAILACIIPYTWLTLQFRKDDKAFEPYEDMKNEANVTRLLAHGYQRVTVRAERLESPPAPIPGSVKPAEAAPGYPAGLATALAEPPPLPLDYSHAVLPGRAAAGIPISIAFTCRLPDDHHVVAGMELYVKNDKIHLVPAFESVGGLSARTPAFSARIIIPGQLLSPGSYQATLLGSQGSATWTLQVH